MNAYVVKQGHQVGSQKRVSKTWEAAQRLKGSIVVIDKSILD